MCHRGFLAWASCLRHFYTLALQTLDLYTHLYTVCYMIKWLSKKIFKSQYDQLAK